MDGDCEYIGREVSQPLIDAVSEVCDVRPSDPITYIADSMKKHHRENSELSQKSIQNENTTQESMAECTVPGVPIGSNKFMDSIELPKYTNHTYPAEFSFPGGFANSGWPVRCYLSFKTPVNVNGGYGGGASLLLISNNYNNKDDTTAEIFLLRSGFDSNHKEAVSLVKSSRGHFGPSTIVDTDEYGRIYLNCLFGNNHAAIFSNIAEYGNLSCGLIVQGKNDDFTDLPLNVNGTFDPVQSEVGGGCSLVVCTGWEGDQLKSALYMIRSGYSENFYQVSKFGGDDHWKFEPSNEGILRVNGLKDSVYAVYHNRLNLLDTEQHSSQCKGQAYTGHIQSVQGSQRTEIFRFKVVSYIHGGLLVLCSTSSGREDATVAAVYLLSVAEDCLSAQYVQGTVGELYPAKSADLWTFTLSGKQVMTVGPDGPCRYGVLTNFPLGVPENFDSHVTCCLATGEADPIRGSVTFTRDHVTCCVSQRSDLVITDNEVDILTIRGEELKMNKDVYAFHSGWPVSVSTGLHLLRIYAVKKHVLDGSERRLELEGSPYELVIQPPGVQLAVNAGSQTFQAFSDVVYTSEFTQFLNLDPKYINGTRCKAVGEIKWVSAVPQILCGTNDGYLYARQRTPHAEGDQEQKLCYQVDNIPDGDYKLRVHFVGETASGALAHVKISGKNVLPPNIALQPGSHTYMTQTFNLDVTITGSKLSMQCGNIAGFALLTKQFKDRQKDQETLALERKEQQKLADEAEPLARTFTRKSRQIVGWSSNLLQNPSAQDKLSHWNLTGNWTVQEGGYGTENCFVTSFMDCIKYQEVNLLEHFSAEYLDTAPPIQVSEWYREGVCGGGHYQLIVTLTDQHGTCLSKFDTGETGRLYHNNKWLQATHTFDNYGQGARIIGFESHGRDDKYWGGHYGALSSNAIVRVQRESNPADNDKFVDIAVSNSEEALKTQKVTRDKLVTKVLRDHQDLLKDSDGQDPAPAETIKDSVPMPIQQRRKQKKREIRVFVSSTFRDFREEREQLIKKTFREVNALCSDRGVFFTYVDLRWGITEEQTCHGQTIAICLQEIDRCRPYFLCLMGDRFGWCQQEDHPDKVLNESFNYVLKNFPDLQWLEKYRFDCSVTQRQTPRHNIKDDFKVLQSMDIERVIVPQPHLLEILHGVLNNPERAKEHSFFYLRDSVKNSKEIMSEADFKAKNSESDWHAEKQNNLRSDINSRENLKLRSYRYIDDACALIKQDLVWCLDQDFPRGTELSPLEREAQAHLAFGEARRRVYIGREEYFTKIDEFFNSGSSRPLVILGESGSGKSALVANWAGRVEDRDSTAFMFVHFIGSSAESASSLKLLRRLYEEIKQFFGFTLPIPTSDANLARDLPTWINMAAAQRKCYIVLDALNQLDDGAGPGEGSEQDLMWLPKELPEGVCMLLSTLPGRAFDAVEAAQLPTMQVKPLQSSEKAEIVTGYLEGIYGKTLSEEQKDMIVNTDKTNNPLYLKALLDEVRMFGSFRQLTSKIQEYLTAGTPGDLFAKILERLEDDFEKGDPPRAGLVRDTTVAIWCSHRGMSEAELLDYLEVPSAIWSPFYLSLRENLVNRNGLLNFFHDHLRQAVQHKYLPSEGDRKAGYARLAEFFDGMPLSDRKAEELPYQLEKCGDLEKLKVIISDLEIFKLLCRTEDGKFDLIKSWQLFGDYTQVEEAYSGQLSSLPQATAPHHLIELEQSLADFYMDLGLFNAARVMFDKVLENLETKHSKSHGTLVSEPGTQKRRYRCNHPAVIQLLHNLGEVCEKQKDLKQAQLYFSDAIRRQNKVSSPGQKLMLTQGLLGQATVLYLMDDAKEAKKYLVRALEIATNVLGDTHHYAAAILNKLGQLSYRQGRLQEALGYFVQDLKLTRGDVGTAHPRTAGILNDLALVYDDMNENEAGYLYEAALIILLGVYGNQHLDVAVTRFNLGSFYFATSSFARAKFQYTEALRVYSLFLGSDHLDTQEVRNALDEVSLFVQKDPTPSQQEVNNLQEVSQKVVTPEPRPESVANSVVSSQDDTVSPNVTNNNSSSSQETESVARPVAPPQNVATPKESQPHSSADPKTDEANASCLCNLM